MSDVKKNEEAPLYVNRKASTVVVKKNSEPFIEKGKTMGNKESDVKDGIQPLTGMSESAGVGNIDKIRDIIFGNQMQDYEKRFVRLEERMFKEMSSSKSETRENFDSLEKLVNYEVEALKDQIKSEQNARGDSLKDIERQLKDINRSLKDQVVAEESSRSESLKDMERQIKEMSRSFEKRMDSLKEQFERNSRELYQKISENSQNLRDEIRKRYDETTSSIDRIAQELRTNKVDRSALADFLAEMAMRITNDRR